MKNLTNSFQQSLHLVNNEAALSRREALYRLGWGAGLALGSGCNISDLEESKKSTGGKGLPVRLNPLRLPIQPLSKSILSKQELHEVLLFAQPPMVTKVFPVSIVYHALRLWGHEAKFPDRGFSNPSVRGRWGEAMLAILTDDRAYREFSTSNAASHLLLSSPYGVIVRTSSDAGFGAGSSSTHPGTYVQVMAELGIPSDYPLQVFDGESNTLADVIRDESRRVSFVVEQEWIASGLCRYLNTTKWKNRFGEWLSFDDIAMHLVNRLFGQGACFGGHIPYALATLLAVQKHGILSASVANAIGDRLQELSERLRQHQGPDGGWDDSWADRTPETEGFLVGTLETKDLDRLSITGHQLEWMTICSPDLRPDESIIQRAVRFLAREIPRIGSSVEMDWHKYMPLSHAARAVLAAEGISRPTEQMLNSSHHSLDNEAKQQGKQ